MPRAVKSNAPPAAAESFGNWEGNSPDDGTSAGEHSFSWTKAVDGGHSFAYDVQANGQKVKVPILTYHQISATPPTVYGKYSVTPARFVRQIRWLALRGYATLSLDAYLRCRVGSLPWPARPVIITIDDGYAEAVRHALEVLPKFGFTATVFLVAGAVGKHSTWVQGTTIPVAGWQTAREMVTAGFTCGSHSVTHPRLAALPPAACARELRESRERLEDGLGVAVMNLAYPYGSNDETVRNLAAEAGYSAACGIAQRLSDYRDDPLNLPRVRVMGDDLLADFVCRLHTAHPVGITLRDRLRRLRWERTYGQS